MSDTTTITQEERTLWLSEAQPKNIDYYEPIDFELDKRIRKHVERCEIAMEQLTPGDYVLFTNGDWVSMATAQRAIHKAEVDSREGQTAIAVTVHKVCTEYEVR